MDNEEITGVKFSQFPSATPGDSDEVVGLHARDNVRFSVANFVLAIRQGLANIFVPNSDVGAANGIAELDSNGKVPSTQLPPISSDAADITYDPTTSGLTATDVQAAIDEVVNDLGGKQDTITANGILKGDGAGGVSAATAGTDYQAPLTAGTDYATPAQLADKAAKADLTNIQATGTTNTTGAAIPAGAYFYLNGALYRAKTQIDQNATFTVNTNCEQVADGVANSLANQIVVESLVLPNTGLLSPNTNATVSTTIPAKTGYVPVACAPGYTGDDQFCWVACALTSNNTQASATVRNVSSSADSGAPRVFVIYQKV